jgi:hypothetical protein
MREGSTDKQKKLGLDGFDHFQPLQIVHGMKIEKWLFTGLGM